MFFSTRTVPTTNAEEKKMKARKVIVTIELLTDSKIEDIKKYLYNLFFNPGEINQIQVNVIKEEKKK